MNHFTSKAITTVLLGLLPMPSFAHTINGVLGKNVSAHYYQVVCGTGSYYIYVDIKGKGMVTTPIVSAQLSKDGIAESITDPKSTDAVASRGIQIYAGDGAYHLTISKYKPGLAKYSIQYHCKDNTNNHTETYSFPIETKR